MAFVVVVVFLFVFFVVVVLHFLQTTDLYLIQNNVWGIWRRIELNDSTFEQQNKWSRNSWRDCNLVPRVLSYPPYGRTGRRLRQKTLKNSGYP